jgi:MbtH protein
LPASFATFTDDDITVPTTDRTAMFEDDDERRYLVVRNVRGQFSVWPTDRDVPAGWTAEGVTGTKAECLHHIDQVWTDLRPLPVGETRS